MLSQSMTLGSGSEIAQGSLLNTNSDDKFVATQSEDIQLSILSDIEVLSQEGAQRAIGMADAAIKDLDLIRSNLGSTQNQLISAIAGITAARINIFSSESTIRDVDFSEEFQNLKKIQILSEAGQFALASANTRASNLIHLLTQTDQR